MITQIRIPITEGGKDNTYNTRYRKLSLRAKKLLKTMVDLHNRNGSTRFNVNNFRTMGYGSWRNVADLFYELESREFGKVALGSIGPEFSVFAPVLQSIG